MNWGVYVGLIKTYAKELCVLWVLLQSDLRLTMVKHSNRRAGPNSKMHTIYCRFVSAFDVSITPLYLAIFLQQWTQVR